MHPNHTHTHVHTRARIRPWNKFHLHHTSASQPSKTIQIIAQHGAVNTAGEMGPGESTTAAQLPRIFRVFILFSTRLAAADGCSLQQETEHLNVAR